MRATTLLTAACLSAFAGGTALADKIKNPTAVFAGLDKITGRIISFEVSVDETVQFGAKLGHRARFGAQPRIGIFKNRAQGHGNDSQCSCI